MLTDEPVLQVAVGPSGSPSLDELVALGLPPRHPPSQTLRNRVPPPVVCVSLNQNNYKFRDERCD